MSVSFNRISTHSLLNVTKASIENIQYKLPLKRYTCMSVHHGLCDISYLGSGGDASLCFALMPDFIARLYLLCV